MALGEALANALVHREYANQTSPVYVDIFYNRIEICSPGEPPEPMTMDLLEEEHKSHPRNPQIARVFYLYGYVEKVGSGIQRMQNALKSAGLQAATFELGKDQTFKVIFSRPQQSAKELLPSTTGQQTTPPSADDLSNEEVVVPRNPYKGLQAFSQEDALDFLEEIA